MRRGQSRFGLLSLRKKNLILSGIDLWGLVGIMLVLLSVMMVCVPPPHYGLSVDRAYAVHSTAMPGAIKEDAMRVVIMRDGSIYFRNRRVALESLPDAIRESVQNGAERKIYISVDARARYTVVEKVLDQIRLAGIREVSFLAEQPYLHR